MTKEQLEAAIERLNRCLEQESASNPSRSEGQSLGASNTSGRGR